MFFGRKRKKPDEATPVTCCICGKTLPKGITHPIKDGWLCLGCWGVDLNAPPYEKLPTVTVAEVRANYDGQYGSSGYHMSGLPVPQYQNLYVTINKRELKIRLDAKTGSTAHIPLGRVLYMNKHDEYTTSTEIIQNTANPGTNALIGGLLLGEVGAIAGASSALKAPQQETKYYLVTTFTIGYRAKDGRKKEIVIQDSVQLHGKPKPGPITSMFDQIISKFNEFTRRKELVPKDKKVRLDL